MLSQDRQVFRSLVWYVAVSLLVGLCATILEYAVVRLLKDMVTGVDTEISLVVIPCFFSFFLFEYFRRSLPDHFRHHFQRLTSVLTLKAYLFSKLSGVEEYHSLMSTGKHGGNFVHKNCYLALEISAAASLIFIVVVKFGAISIFALIPLSLLAVLSQLSKKISLKENSKVSSKASQFKAQLLKSAFALRVHKAIPDALKKFERLQEKVDKDDYYLDIGKHKIQTVTEMLGLIVIISAFYIGTKYFQTDRQEAVLYFYIFIRLSQRAGSVSRHLSHYREFKKSFNLLIRKLNFESIIDSQISASPVSKLQAIDLQFGYQTPLTAPMNFTISKGQFVVMKGKSGSGKSTLLKTMIGTIPRLGGQIIYDEIQNKTIGVDCGYYSSTPDLFNGTINENLTYFKEIKNQRIISEALTKAQCEFIPIDQTNLSIDADDVNLSSGQLQRINLARIFVFSPSLIILDEAFSNLDAETESKLLQELLKDKSRLTIVLATHTSKFDEFADQIIHIESL